MDNRPTSYAKLDSYDYKFRRVDGKIYAIVVYVDSLHDVEVADIASEITASEGNIYVEGNYFKLVQMYTKTNRPDAVIYIEVEEN